MSKKNVLPSIEEVKSKKGDLADYFKKVSSGEIILRNKKETVTDRLALITKELKSVKGKGIPYSILSQIVFTQVGLKVSEQTLRKFCQDKLQFPRSDKSKTSKRSSSENSIQSVKSENTLNTEKRDDDTDDVFSDFDKEI